MPDMPMNWQKRQIEKRKKKSSGSAIGGIAGALGFGLNPSRDASSLAEVIEKQAAVQKGLHNIKTGLNSEQNVFQSIQDQLFDQMNSINIAPTPYEQLRAMAESQVAAQFDPMIAQLNSEMSGKKKRGGRSKKEARQMYDALSDDFEGQLPALEKQFNAEDESTEARYDSAKEELAAQYNTGQDQQNDMLRQLGVQAAQQEASQTAQDDQKYFQQLFNADEQADLSALNEQQNAATVYQRDLANNADMAGENRAQEIGQMLEDYLTQAGSQMTGLKNQRTTALEALFQQLQAQDSQRVQQQEQQEMDNLFKLFNFQLAAQKAGDSAAKRSMQDQESLFKGTSGLSGASNYLAQAYPDQDIRASNLMEQINDVLSNKDVIRGKYTLEKGDPSTGKGAKYSDVGQEYMMDLLRREFEKEGDRYNTQDINNTMNALLAYMGKLR